MFPLYTLRLVFINFRGPQQFSSERQSQPFSSLCFLINVFDTEVLWKDGVGSLWNKSWNSNSWFWWFLIMFVDGSALLNWRNHVFIPFSVFGLCVFNGYLKHFICLCQYQIWCTYYIFYMPCADSPHSLHKQIRDGLWLSSGMIIINEKSLAGTFNML